MTALFSVLLEGLWNADIGGIQFCFWLTLATLLFSSGLKKREHWVLRAAVSIGVFLLLGLLIPPYTLGNHFETMLWFVTAYFINVAVVYSYCRITVLEAFACAAYGSLTEHIASAAYILLMVGGVQSNVLYWLISLIDYAAIWFTVGRRMATNGHYKSRGFQKVIVCALCIMVVTVLSYLCKQRSGLFAGGITNDTVADLLRYSQLYGIAFCIVMLTMEYQHESQLRIKDELAASHELLRTKKDQYTLTRENIDLINRKCHDMKHQVTLLMAQGGEKNAMREQYSREIVKAIEVYDSNIDTGNEVLNTILMDKSLYCSMHDITWTCIAHGAVLAFMDQMDLAALMGNALDNAVEAVEHITDKKRWIINVQIDQKERFAQIRVENSFDGLLEQDRERLITRKADKEVHGFGVASIRAIAEKYGGYASIATEGKTFILSILIPIPASKQKTKELQGETSK